MILSSGRPYNGCEERGESQTWDPGVREELNGKVLNLGDVHTGVVYNQIRLSPGENPAYVFRNRLVAAPSSTNFLPIKLGYPPYKLRGSVSCDNIDDLLNQHNFILRWLFGIRCESLLTISHRPLQKFLRIIS